MITSKASPLPNAKKSRREILRGLGTAALAGGAVAASATRLLALASAHASAAQDPIFAVIDAYKQAKAAQREAVAAANRLREKAGFWSGATVNVCGLASKFLTREALEREINSLRPVMKAVGSETFEADASAALESFDAALRAYEDRKDVSALIAANDHADNLTEELADAEDAVMRAKPRTPAGLVALLVFAAEFSLRGAAFEPGEIAPVLVLAARAIAGRDASQIELSEKLSAVLAG
jgi:hypothetical protein